MIYGIDTIDYIIEYNNVNNKAPPDGNKVIHE